MSEADPPDIVIGVDTHKYTHAAVAVTEFGARLAAKMASLTVGRGTQDGVDVGPLIDEAAQRKVADLVADAVGRGATVLAGGGEHDGAGYFYAPTVLTGVPAETRPDDNVTATGPETPFTSCRSNWRQKVSCEVSSTATSACICQRQESCTGRAKARPRP